MILYRLVIIMKKQLRGSIYLLLATIFWGSTFVAQEAAMNFIRPFTFQAVRTALGALCLMPVIFMLDKKEGKGFWQGWKDPKLWKAGILCGLPLFLAGNLQQLGIGAGTDAGKSGFLTAMYILFVPLIGIFRKEKPPKLLPVSLILAVVGLYCLSCVGVTSISTGDLLLLCCAFMYAVQIIVVDQFVSSVDPVRLNAIQIIVSSLLTSVLMFTMETPTLTGIGNCWLPILYAGVLSSAAAFTLQIVGQKDLSPSLASLIMSLESVFAVLTGLMFGGTMTKYEGIGCVLIFTAVILCQIPLPQRKKTKA